MIDTHIHLDSEPYGDWVEVLDRAGAAGVGQVVVPATQLESSRRILDMAREDDRVLPAVGIHPHQAVGFSTEGSPAALKELAAEAVAIGETGLELHYDFCPLEVQLGSLRAQLRLARDLELPVILHCREAEELLYQELKAMAPFPAGGVVHCFTGPWEWGGRFLELGFHLGVTGMVTFKKAANVHEVARRCPAERLLVETDGPYLAPLPHRGKRNEPGYIPLIVDAVAALRRETPEDVARQTTLAARQLFGSRVKLVT